MEVLAEIGYQVGVRPMVNCLLYLLATPPRRSQQRQRYFPAGWRCTGSSPGPLPWASMPSGTDPTHHPSRSPSMAIRQIWLPKPGVWENVIACLKSRAF